MLFQNTVLSMKWFCGGSELQYSYKYEQCTSLQQELPSYNENKDVLPLVLSNCITAVEEEVWHDCPNLQEYDQQFSFEQSLLVIAKHRTCISN